MVERKEFLRLVASEEKDVVLVDQGSELDLVIDFGANGTKETVKLGVSDVHRLADELRAWARRAIQARREKR